MPFLKPAERAMVIGTATHHALPSEHSSDTRVHCSAIFAGLQVQSMLEHHRV